MKEAEPSTIALYSDEPPTETPTWNDVRIHKLPQSTHPCHIVVGDREVWLRDSQAVHKAGEIIEVRGKCRACQHQWKPKGVTQVTQLPGWRQDDA